MLLAVCALALVTRSTELTISGRTLDAEGRPIPAHVVVGCLSANPISWSYGVLTETRADAGGRFSFQVPDEWIQRTTDYRDLGVFAYLEGHGIAYQRWGPWSLPVGIETELRLPPSAAQRIRIVDPDGAPIVGARVWPQVMGSDIWGESRMPANWWREHAAHTDEDGWTVLPTRLEDLDLIGFEAEGHGRQSFARSLATHAPLLPNELVALRLVERELRIVAPELSQAELKIQMSGVRKAGEDCQYNVEFEQRLPIAGEGTLHVLAPRGALRVSVSTEDASALLLEPAGQDFSGGRDPVDSTLLRQGDPWRVRGRAVHAGDGTPVAGVRFLFQSMHAGWVLTDEDGRFEFVCGSRGVRLGSFITPPAFAGERFFQGPTASEPQEAEEVDLGDVLIHPTETASGIVRGPDGEEVQGAWVVGMQKIPRGSLATFNYQTALTDADGGYTLPGTRAGIMVSVSARLGDLSCALKEMPAESLELVLGSSLSARGSARLTDGRPAGDVQLEVWRASPPKVWGGEQLVRLGGQSAVGTREDGSFETASGLEADGTYCLTWSGDPDSGPRARWVRPSDDQLNWRLRMQGPERPLYPAPAHDRARVLDDARRVAEALPTEGWPGYARSRLGEVLARVDFEAGRALIDEYADVEDRPRHLFNTAHELAAGDPERAEALVTQLAAHPGRWGVERYIARIAYRMAPADLERARRLAASHDRTGFSDGMIALALAERDPEQARASLEEAFQRAEHLAGREFGIDERPISSTAALLPVAERVDPDGLRAYVARVLALKRPAASRRFGGDLRMWREDATLAFYLARWKPELAKQILEPATLVARNRRNTELRSEADALWAAAAVIDPAWAAVLAREVGGRAASTIGLVLALPPGFRTIYVQDEILGLWVVGKEDI